MPLACPQKLPFHSQPLQALPRPGCGADCRRARTPCLHSAWYAEMPSLLVNEGGGIDHGVGRLAVTASLKREGEQVTVVPVASQGLSHGPPKHPARAKKELGKLGLTPEGRSWRGTEGKFREG